VYESVLDAVLESQKNKRPLVIDIMADPDPMVIYLFKYISREGSIVVDDAGGRQRRIVPIKSPIMVVVGRKFIEKGISYRNSYDLFGPGISISQKHFGRSTTT
jgi:hypothetical protein